MLNFIIIDIKMYILRVIYAFLEEDIIMKFDLSKFIGNLFALIHSWTLAISSDRVLKTSSREEPDAIKLLSSAKRINCKFVDTLHSRSFIYSRNNNGPNIEPCGTPILTSDTYRYES